MDYDATVKNVQRLSDDELVGYLLSDPGTVSAGMDLIVRREIGQRLKKYAAHESECDRVRDVLRDAVQAAYAVEMSVTIKQENELRVGYRSKLKAALDDAKGGA